MPAEYEVLEPGGHQAFADAVKSYADRAGGTGTTQLANGSVTTAKLADEVKAGLNTPDEFPALAAGSSRALLGDPETASWMERTTAADGAALIESVKGNTLRWNQLVGADTSTVTIPSGHKYHSVIGGTSAIATSDGTAISVTGGTDQLFDLTQMFGAGNEPATVDEFEALYPLPYYPYDAGSLLPVRMEGIETVGFNQWDEQTAEGVWNNDGTMSSTSAYICCKNKIPVIPGQTYYIQRPAVVTNVYLHGYGADGINGINISLPGTNLLTIPDGVHFITFAVQKSQYGTTYKGDICINLSDPARNGTYEPYWSSMLAIPATDLRSAGTVRDEQRANERITRVGVVDLGTLTWTYSSNTSRFYTNGLASAIAPATSGQPGNIVCVAYDNVRDADTINHVRDKIMSLSNTSIVNVYDTSYGTDTAAFKAAMDGVMLYYELATPTVTPYDSPLNLTYRTAAGGTERVMVASGTTSAPPIFVTRYPLDPADLAASIAPADGPTAKTNHQVGDLLMLGFTLCKATQVIVTGETIAIGTNVTRTTVAAELAALSQ